MDRSSNSAALDRVAITIEATSAALIVSRYGHNHYCDVNSKP